MIAEDMKSAIATMRSVLARNNEDFLHLAPYFLDCMEEEAERVEAMETAVLVEFPLGNAGAEACTASLSACRHKMGVLNG